MKEYGILMSAPMVRAYLADLKTQTRRTRGLDLINENPDAWKFNRLKLREDGSTQAWFERPIRTTLSETKWVKMPYGETGDRLWFKETHAIGSEESIVYRANYLDGGLGADSVVHFATGELTPLVWKPSIFMKRKYARIVTPVLNVRVERLQDITELDAMYEGMWNGYTSTGPEDYHRQKYFELWDQLNGKKLPAEKNPWVWVYEFARRSEKKDGLHVESI